MSIRTRLVFTILACGILPTMAVGWLSHSISSAGASELQVRAQETLKAAQIQSLEAVTHARRNDLRHYFDGLAAEVRTLARCWPRCRRRAQKIQTSATLASASKSSRAIGLCRTSSP